MDTIAHGSKHAPRYSFKRGILLPLGLALVVLLLAFVATTYWRQYQMLQRQTAEVGSDFERSYQNAVEDEVATLTALLEVLQNDGELKRVFTGGDRQELLHYVQPLFETLRDAGQLTHLYFISPDRKVVLRVHQPGRFGDIINRFTATAAQNTGTVAHGIELGPLGTFTLRVVAPWMDDGKLLGYIEFGSDMEHLLFRVGQQLELDLFVLINKQLLRREDWEIGNAMLGSQNDWDMLPEYTLASHTLDEPERQFIAGHFTEEGAIQKPHEGHIDQINGRYMHLKLLPLFDLIKHEVGYVGIVDDITASEVALRRVVLTTAAIYGAVASALFALVYRLTGRIERHLSAGARDRAILKDRSRRDPLTELLNQREFYNLLNRQLGRARNSGASLAVLMLDVDEFKLINDSYGHPAGDQVLREVANILRSNVRPLDALARYGGEEFAVILPDMPVSEAAELAERIREAFVDAPIQTDLYDINVTVSIGAAAFPADGPTSGDLVEAADKALYVAKRGGRNQVRVARDATPERPTQDPAVDAGDGD